MRLAMIQISFILVLMTLSHVHEANGIPSYGIETSLSYLSKFPDNAFHMDLNKGSRNTGKNFTVLAADLSKFPVLAAKDVQYSFSTLDLKPGTAFIPHYHPRASELVFAIKGTFRVEIFMEGIPTRVVNVTFGEGNATVVPQGIIQRTSCIGYKPCQSLDVLSSADPGFVPVRM